MLLKNCAILCWPSKTIPCIVWCCSGSACTSYHNWGWLWIALHPGRTPLRSYPFQDKIKTFERLIISKHCIHIIYCFPYKVNKLYLHRMKHKMWGEELDKDDKSFLDLEKNLFWYVSSQRRYLWKMMTVMRQHWNAFFDSETRFSGW